MHHTIPLNLTCEIQTAIMQYILFTKQRINNLSPIKSAQSNFVCRNRLSESLDSNDNPYNPGFGRLPCLETI